MALQFAELAALQTLDTEIDRLQRERARLVDASALQREMEAARARHAAQAKRLHDLQVRLQDAELELKSVEGKKRDFERRLYEGKVTNPKELTAMEREIEMLGRQRGRLDETILTVMEEIETAREELAKGGKAQEAAEAAWKSADATFRAEVSRIETAYKDLAPRRGQAAAAVEPATLRRYDEMRARNGGVAVAPSTGGTCGGCHTGVPAAITRRLREGTAYVHCENCNRFLLPDTSG